MADLLRVCKAWKKNKKCPFQHEASLPTCWRPDCPGFIHEGCSNLLMDRNEVKQADRPTPEDRTDPTEPVVFCTKTCHLKWKAHRNRLVKAAKKGEEVKPRVAWDDDGTIAPFVEWLTTEGNYANYCGATGNKGISKSAYHKIIAHYIKQKMPESGRTERDVENKIGKLERQHRDMVDWKNATGAGLDEPGQVDAHVKKKCPYFDELDDIMGSRPNAQPIFATENDSVDSDDESIDDILFNNNTTTTATAVEISAGNSGDTEDNVESADASHETPLRRTAEKNSSSGSGGSGDSGKADTSKSGKKRVNSNGTRKGKRPKKTSVDDLIKDLIGGDDDDDNENFKSLRTREVLAIEKQATARMMEASANSTKVEKEAKLLDIEMMNKLLRTRKGLVEDGICSEDEVNKRFPLPEE